jgi:hypothetical protein
MGNLDYYFLEAAITEIIGFSWIVPDDGNGGAFILDNSTCSTINEIAESLYRLFQEGYLLAIYSSDLSEVYTDASDSFDADILLSQGFTPSFLQINSALKQEENLFYFLTSKGGKLWESVSYPKWDQYYFSAGNGQKHLLQCHSRKLAEELLKIQHLLDFGRSYHVPIIETVKWNFLTPWQPTYWKTLSSGYEINYQVTCIDVDMIENEDKELMERRKQAEKWVKDKKKWYTKRFNVE